MLLQLNEILRDDIQFSRNIAATLDGFQYVGANSLHSAVFKGSG